MKTLLIILFAIIAYAWVEVLWEERKLNRQRKKLKK